MICNGKGEIIKFLLNDIQPCHIQGLSSIGFISISYIGTEWSRLPKAWPKLYNEVNPYYSFVYLWPI